MLIYQKLYYWRQLLFCINVITWIKYSVINYEAICTRHRNSPVSLLKISILHSWIIILCFIDLCDICRQTILSSMTHKIREKSFKYMNFTLMPMKLKISNIVYKINNINIYISYYGEHLSFRYMLRNYRSDICYAMMRQRNIWYYKTLLEICTHHTFIDHSICLYSCNYLQIVHLDKMRWNMINDDRKEIFYWNWFPLYWSYGFIYELLWKWNFCNIYIMEWISEIEWKSWIKYLNKVESTIYI